MDDERTLSDKLSGRIRRPVDAGGKKVLFARILRSPVNRGRLAGIDLPDPPQGVTGIIAKEVPGSARLYFGGIPVPVLAGRRILWRGQPVVAAAGADIGEVDDWLSRIKLNIQESDEDRKPDESEFQRAKGNPSDAFVNSFQVIEESFVIPRRSNVVEPAGTTCLRDGRSYSIHTATAWPGAVRRSVARALGIDPSSITVRPYSSAPGAKYHAEIWHPAVDAATVALLSWKAKRSVRLDTLPAESVRFGPETPGAEFHLRGALNGEGRIMAMECDITVDCGAVMPLENEILDRIIIGLFGVYPCRHYSIRGRIRRRPLPPSTFGPAAGLELGFLAGELFVSRVAGKSLVSPAQWRRDSFPVAGQRMGPGIVRPKDFPLPMILEKALTRSDYERKSAAHDQTLLARHKLSVLPEEFRGVGLSAVGFGNGFSGSVKELGSASLGITLEKNCELLITGPPINSGPLTGAWGKIAGDILGVGPDAIRFVNELPWAVNEPGPSILGRNVTVYIRLLELACRDLAKRRFRETLPISVSRSRPRSNKMWIREKFEGSPFEIYSWGVGVVEVSVSSRTGDIMTIRTWLVIDGGHLLMGDYARAAVENSAEEALWWCIGRKSPGVIPLIDVEFYGNQPRRPPRDVSTLPWLLMPTAFVQAMRQASGSGIDRLPITLTRLRSGGSYE